MAAAAAVLLQKQHGFAIFSAIASLLPLLLLFPFMPLRDLELLLLIRGACFRSSTCNPSILISISISISIPFVASLGQNAQLQKVLIQILVSNSTDAEGSHSDFS